MVNALVRCVFFESSCHEHLLCILSLERMNHGLPDPICNLRGGCGHLYHPSLQILGPAADPVHHPSQLSRKGKQEERVAMCAIPIFNAQWHCYDALLEAFNIFCFFQVIAPLTPKWLQNFSQRTLHRLFHQRFVAEVSLISSACRICRCI